jgi:hypothetical protein
MPASRESGIDQDHCLRRAVVHAVVDPEDAELAEQGP